MGSKLLKLDAQYVNEYVPEFNLNCRLIHQGDYFFALDISKALSGKKVYQKMKEVV